MSKDSRLLSDEELEATLRTIARYNDILGIRVAERRLRAHIQALTEKCEDLKGQLKLAVAVAADMEAAWDAGSEAARREEREACAAVASEQRKAHEHMLKQDVANRPRENGAIFAAKEIERRIRATLVRPTSLSRPTSKTAQARHIQEIREQRDVALQRVEELERHLGRISTLGIDVAPADDPEAFYRRQLCLAISIAAMGLRTPAGPPERES